MTTISRNARIAGFLYILASAVGIVRLLYIPKALFVRGDAAATAANIAAHEPLFRIGIVCYLVGGVLWLFVPLALYRLLSGVDRKLAILMVILGSLMQTPMYVVNTVTDGAALLLIRGAEFASIAGKAQRDVWAFFFLRLHHQLDLADMIFAGLWLFPLGRLIYRSRFLPRFLGVWLMIGCFAWVTFSLSGLLFPGSEDKIFTYMQPVVFGEVVLMLWLVIFGANEKRAAVTNLQTA